MKYFIVLVALVACAAAEEKRDKRGLISGGWDSLGSVGYGGGLSGLGVLSGYSAPATRVVTVNKLVNTQRVVDVPQVINVRKVVNVPQVVSVNKVVADPGLSSGIALGSGGWW